MKKVLYFLLTFILLFANINTAADTPQFCLIYQSVKDGENNVAATKVLEFEFNLRVDPELKGILLNGSGELIDKVLLKEGKKLEIHLKEELKTGTRYTLSLDGIKEIYEGKCLSDGVITFTTKYNVEMISEEISEVSGKYKALIKNSGINKAEVTVILTVRDKTFRNILKVKILKQSIEGGSEKEFLHTFTDIEGEYMISAYAFLDMTTMITVEK